ncbi:hypothetical protein CXG81DRAFT_17179 [Caulochytrium protostelioides]|uniref:RNA polymerase II subunit A C-terminal domain phosphatase SSU72 n=1 Tax=Caulochytrium protostelioides TaxID=1555241 RepID=A0A4P9XDK2_9FUNG|nr:hypothetical protein CXG81DRAFT_17179 [Caulochytrium protostelioides]|eukprot:RKP03221.1 hypothetical protein CXG81DRAFT_17179 [Caulochytrium protostelioides]
MPQQSDTRICVICKSNQNRSMEAHHVLKNSGFTVWSFGTGSAVRLPGPSIDRPNVYPFGVPYDTIYEDLIQQDARLYTANGLLGMLDRNRKIKAAPEKFQDAPGTFDVIISCEERCFDQALEDLVGRPEPLGRPVHVVNVEIKDNHTEAAKGAEDIKRLVEAIDQATNRDEAIADIVTRFQEKTKRPLLHAVAYY